MTPLFLGWVTTSVITARLTVRVGYRRIVIAGVSLLTISFGILAMVTEHTQRTTLLGAVLMLGCGLGLAMLALLLAVQHGVERSQLGIATSLNQFARSVGSAVGVALMGALLARGLQGALPEGLPGMTAGMIKLEGLARERFAGALAQVFTAARAEEHTSDSSHIQKTRMPSSA